MNVSSPINYSNSAIFYPDATGVLGSFTKSPDAQTSITLDYTDFLTAIGRTIQSVSYLLNFGSAPQLVVSGSSIQGNNDVLGFVVSGGLNGLKYVIQIKVTMDDNTTIDVQHLEVVVSSPFVGDECGCPPMSMSKPLSGNLSVSSVFQQASILNGDGTRFGSSFVVFWVSDQAPPTANILDRWYNTQDGLIYDRATDGYSVFWVSSAQRPTKYVTGTVPPANPAQGDIWFNTATNTINIFINTGTGNNWFTI